MAIPRKKIIGFLLVFVVLVSAYLTVVQIVNGLDLGGLLNSLSVTGLKKPNAANRFVVNDMFVVEAKCRRVSAYCLQFYLNSSLVFEKEGETHEPTFNVSVPIVPPAFSAGKAYVAVLHVYSYNDPLPGAFHQDSRSYAFEVAGTETRLVLAGEYCRAFGNLCLNANLTDVAGFPIASESVDFCLQLSDRSRITDGWLPVGSSVTDASGIAELSLALNMPAGNYSARACHAGDENFGESEGDCGFEVLTPSFLEGFDFSALSEDSSRKHVSSSSVGTVSISVSSNSPYAVLPMNATALYTVDVPLDPAATCQVIIFYSVDSYDQATALGISNLSLVSDSHYVYGASLSWTPNVVGSRLLVAGVVVGDVQDLYRAINNRTETIASANVGLNIQSCPNRLTFHLAEAVHGSALSVVVAFSKPRRYEARDLGGFTAFTLGQHFNYSGGVYMVDSPVKQYSVKLYVNDTLVATNMTDNDGLAYFLINLESANVHGGLNIMVALDDPSLVYGGTIVGGNVNFTKVNVHDVGSKSDYFNLNCTASQSGQNNGNFYVGVDTAIMVNASLLGGSVWDAPVSVLVGKPLSRKCTNSSAGNSVSTPLGASYLRVARLYDVASTTAANAACDIDHDGSVGVKDYYAVCKAYQSSPGSSKWNWRADINFDMTVDIKDVYQCAASYSKNVEYYNVSDFSCVVVVFSDGYGGYGGTSLDSSGCVSVPSWAKSCWFYIDGQSVGAVVEFFDKASHSECSTDYGGTGVVSWVPADAGMFCALAWLPPSFRASVPVYSDVTELNAPLTVAVFFNVSKRPVSMSIGYAPENPNLDNNVTVSASCFDDGLGEPLTASYVDFFLHGLTVPNGNETNVYLGYSVTNASGVAVYSFIPRTYYEQHSLFPYFYVVAVCFETDCTAYAQAYALLDTRYPTRLEFLGDKVVYAPVGQPQQVRCRLVRADTGDPVNASPIRYYVNDTFKVTGYTGADGISGVGLTIYVSGVYFVVAEFSWGEGYFDTEYRYCENATLVVVAQAVPVFVLFEVSPKEFRPGTTVMLRATLYNASDTTQKLVGFVVRFYWCDQYNNVGLIGTGVLTGSDGVASISWTYPTSGVYVFWARVSESQQIMSSPVMLTVGKDTALSLGVAPPSGFDHVFSGKLTCDGQPVANKQIEVKINGTVVVIVSTQSDGSYNITITMKPVNNKPTIYQVEVSFYGDSALNLTGVAALPNGTEYNVCTTLYYYGYKPSANSVWLTVEPQATQAMTQNKTPEQVQQEANNTGWFWVWHEFSWWYPWYRMHFVLNTTLPPYGMIYADYGWSLLPFGASFQTNATVFALILNDIGTEIATDVILGLAVGYVIQRVVAGIAGKTLAGIGLAIGVYLGYSTLSAWALYASSGNSPKAWLAAFLSSAIGSFMDVLIQGLNAIEQWLTAASLRVLGEISHTLNSMWARGLDFFDITGIAFTFIDFALMISYLTLYKTWT